MKDTTSQTTDDIKCDVCGSRNLKAYISFDKVLKFDPEKQVWRYSGTIADDEKAYIECQDCGASTHDWITEWTED